METSSARYEFQRCARFRSDVTSVCSFSRGMFVFYSNLGTYLRDSHVRGGNINIGIGPNFDKGEKGPPGR